MVIAENQKSFNMWLPVKLGIPLSWFLILSCPYTETLFMPGLDLVHLESVHQLQ